jgi:carbonic anhydrase
MADVLVLSCIDPRFTYLLGRFLSTYKQIKNRYDLFALAGSSLGCNIQPKWQTTFFEHVDIAEMLHGIKEIWVFEHLDCAAYKVFLNVKSDNVAPHVEQLATLKEKINAQYPHLGFKGFIMNKKGAVERLI